MLQRHRSTSVLLGLLITVAALAGCTGQASDPGPAPSAPADRTDAPDPAQAQLRPPAEVTVVDGDTPAVLAQRAAQALFTSAPVAVVVASTAPEQVQAAGAAAAELGAPVLLDTDSTPTGTATTTPTEPTTSTLAEPLQALGVTAVLSVGQPASALAARLPETTVVEDAADLPPTTPAPPLDGTTVLVRSGDAAEPAVAAAGVVAATAAATGAEVVTVSSDDPRADAEAVTALAAAPTGGTLAVGSGFGPADVLTPRLDVARTGVQLPGGGQTMFPGRALVALYGYPGSTALGVLGEQDPAASIARAQEVAAPYADLYDVPVIPTFEIIATVASGSPGADGDYANEADLDELRPLVDAATEAGGYVVLDLQPGRADLVEQAELYRELLIRPNVGLAIDPEWSLDAGQLPLEQIGSVTAEEINAVTTWLADLTAENTLPQKVLVLHQFRLSMIEGKDRLDQSRDEVALLVHADGQGYLAQKEETWNAIVNDTPPGIELGWKNFYDEDPDMASPETTVDRDPVPLMISYQ